jgi:hypothetical protein
MDRNKRTAVVVLVAVLLAAAASLGMYRVVAARPIHEGATVKRSTSWSRSIRSRSAPG